MNNKIIYRGFAFLSFLVTLVVYIMTMQPSTPFWDCGEFSAAAVWQQVPHPPGTPLFLMVGKLFQLIIPFGDDNWRINFVSVVVTALSVFLLYLITVKVIENLRKDPVQSISDALAVYGSAFVGAMAFCFSDTLWFNGVESEVYASTTAFTAIVVYFMMRWNEVADKPGHERYLLLIAYLTVLSSGIHLLAILTMYSVFLVVYFRKYKVTVKSFIIMGILAVVSFFFVYQIIIMWIPNFLAGNLPFKNAAREYLVEGNPIITVLFIAALVALAFGLYRSYTKSRKILTLVFTAISLMIFAYTVNTHILIRANSNPPLNENEPSSFKRLVSYLGREQYGESKYWPRRFDFRDGAKIKYYAKYGEWYQPESQPVKRKDGMEVSDYVFKKVNFSGEMNYLFKYQIDHMFLRYFYWNFVGRSSDIQDAPHTFIDRSEADFINFKSGEAKNFPVRFFAIPLLFGIIGLFFHFWKDPKMALAYLVMFLLMGVLAAIAQNQLERQPRERDYFYTGAFMVWCLWIGLGAYYFASGIFIKKKLATPAVAALIAASFVLVPVNMAVGGWNIHSRAKNYLPLDFAYNLLQSCEKDAILFTAGDNDTFPLWNVQDVLGVRRDVRVVNLSLGGTLWYVNQLKNHSPWGAKKIPLEFADDSIQVDEYDPKALSYFIRENPIPTSVKVPREFMEKYTTDSAALANCTMRFDFLGDVRTLENNQKRYLYFISDRLVHEIIRTCMGNRPIYFSFTTGNEANKYGLSKFLRSEGLVSRVLPVEASKSIDGEYDMKVMNDCLIDKIDNSDNVPTEPTYGFKFRNLNNVGVFYDEKHRENIDIYRNVYLNYAKYLLVNKRDSANCIRLLDAMNNNLSIEQFPLWHDEARMIEEMYRQAGSQDKADALFKGWVDQMTGGNYQVGIENLLKRYTKYRTQYKIDESNKYEMRPVVDCIFSISGIERFLIKQIEKSSGKEAAAKETERVIAKYKSNADRYLQVIAEDLNELLVTYKKPIPIEGQPDSIGQVLEDTNQ
jgi:hypothetical protein